MPEADHSVTDTDVAVWDQVMAVNVRGVFLGCKYAIPQMIEGGGGSIINIASFVALVGCSVPQDAYTASKGALLALTRSLAVQFGPNGVRTNAICPGPVETPLLMDWLVKDEEAKRIRLARNPTGRFGKPEEIVNMAIYLASDESRWTNGAAARRRRRHHRQLLLGGVVAQLAIGVDVGGSGIKAGAVDLASGRLVGERVRIATPNPSTPDASWPRPPGSWPASGGGVARRRAGERRCPGRDRDPVGRDRRDHPLGGQHRCRLGRLPGRDRVPTGPRRTRSRSSTTRTPRESPRCASGPAAARCGTVFVLTLGTGVGSALFVDGVLVPNTELGHMEIRGRDAERRSAANARIRRGLSWKAWASDLDEHLIAIDRLFSPNLFILGGGVSKNPDKFIPLLTVRVPVVPAELRNDAGIVGAALFVAAPGWRPPDRRRRRPARRPARRRRPVPRVRRASRIAQPAERRPVRASRGSAVDRRRSVERSRRSARSDSVEVGATPEAIWTILDDPGCARPDPARLRVDRPRDVPTGSWRSSPRRSSS